MAEKDIVTACLILIGNEILSGRTQDKNLNFLAKLRIDYLQERPQALYLDA